MSTTQDSDSGNDVTFTIGHEQLVIHRRYETASIFNDFLIAIWFLFGSVLFLYPQWADFGTWLFVIGSAQFMIRPMIRLAHHIYLRRIPRNNNSNSHWASRNWEM
ncbi:YrhK family protein [Acidihalobacter prosperus]